MTSTLTWLDYSEHERRKAMDVIDLVILDEFGQPRREDLVEYLLSRLTPDEVQQLAGRLSIDLAPDLSLLVGEYRFDTGTNIATDLKGRLAYLARPGETLDRYVFIEANS